MLGNTDLDVWQNYQCLGFLQLLYLTWEKKNITEWLLISALSIHFVISHLWFTPPPQKKKIHKLILKFFFFLFGIILICHLKLWGDHRSSSSLHQNIGKHYLSYITFVLFSYTLVTYICPYLQWKQKKAQLCLA